MPGPDEDPFTLAVAALERATGNALPAAARTQVDWLGPCPEVARWGIAAALGADVELRSHPSDGPTLASILAEPTEPSEVRWVLLVEPGDSPPEGRSALAAGSVALSLRAGSSGGVDPSSLPPNRDGESPVDRVVRWLGGTPAGPSGDLPKRPAAGPKSSGSRAGGAAAPSTVSEGAYVPRATYLAGIPSRWRFEAESCPHCGHLGFPRRDRCRACGRSDGLTIVRLPRDEATVEAVTWIGSGGQPTEFDGQVAESGPYGVALVGLPGGVRATLQLADTGPGSVRIGDRMSTELRRLYPMDGEWRYGRKAVPLLTDARPA